MKRRVKSGWYMILLRAPYQLGHLAIGFNVGFTEPQLKQVLSLIETQVGKKEAEAGQQVHAKVMASRK